MVGTDEQSFSGGTVMRSANKLRDVALSTVAASVETFMPRRLLTSTLVGESANLVERVLSEYQSATDTVRKLLVAAANVPAIVAEARDVVGAASLLVCRMDGVTERAAATIGEVAALQAAATSAVHDAQQVEKRMLGLLDRCAALIGAETEIDPAVIRATSDAVSRLRPLLGALASINTEAASCAGSPQFGPGVAGRQAGQRVTADIRTGVAGRPGAGRLVPRGERILDSAACEHHEP